jgi:ankyrin repeat protein
VGAVEVLLKARTDLSLRNRGGHTALEVAVEHGHDKVAALIRAHQAKL